MNMKTVLVTAGSAGIGLSLVRRLAAAGHTVYFTYRSSEETARELARLYPSAVGLRVDFSSAGSFAGFLRELGGLPLPDVLINNFGVNNDSLFLTQPLEEFFSAFDQNFKVPVAVIKTLLEGMIARRSGHIINISSVAAGRPKAGNAAYGASKASLERFSKSLALEVARFGIKVNCIAPGFVDTPLLERYLKENQLERSALLKNIPARKLLAPDDIVNIAQALMDGTLNTTGSVISVGNGENVH